ncbi:hypothetical protein [Amaricoccus sp.]|uniref:hypothetical protein n=1 Tax=Amaricoccus sp. TaxID=1872485 RepID=UPI001D773118|nr:hypothetical protein [Amaricoccus sp.]MCB1401692.1 hypothetical protein [Paracoccaceae bacterium]MCC0067317.1 hypothetical protein [Rhodovulum sp.]HRW15103.1 hypothetical protein [Amaricoccus sp.]
MFYHIWSALGARRAAMLKAEALVNRFTGSVTLVVDGDMFWISSRDTRIRVCASTPRKSTRPAARRRQRRRPR